MIGRILRIDAKLCHVEVDGKTMALPLRGRLFEARGLGKRPVAVGDRVEVRLEDGGGSIEEVLPRASQLVRGAGDTGREHVIAANVTLVLAVAALRDPPLRPQLLDRILAGAEAAGIAAALLLTKADLDEGGEAATLRAIYEPLGYRVLTSSVHGDPRTDRALVEVAELLHGNTTVLCGASGIGKSSLLNHLLPGLGLRVGAVSRARHGRHTTTSTQLVPLPGGGHVLDTPGIRGFELFEVPRREISGLFPELREASAKCDYRDCEHRHEPRCAVRDAVERGEIAGSRYESYLSMLGE